MINNGLAHLTTLQPSYFKLFNNNNEVAIFIESGSNTLIDESGDYILFYAEDHLNKERFVYEDVYFDPYDYRNVYWLTFEPSTTIPGKRLFTKDVSLAETNTDKIFKPEFYHKKVHIEENLANKRGAIVEIENEFTDKGFYHHRDFVVWGDELEFNSFSSYDIPILDDYYSNSDSVNFTVMMTGAENINVNNHSVDIKVSQFSYSSPVGLDWKLSRKQKLNFKVPVVSLLEENDFAIKNTNPNGNQLLNYVELEFDTKFKSRNNMIDFVSPKPIPQPGSQVAYEVFEYEISNFSNQNLIVLEKGESLLKNFKVESDGEGKFNLRFQDHIENVNAEFVVIDNLNLKEPVKASRINNSKVTYTNSGLQNFKSNAEMVILTTDLFLDIAKEYKNFKNGSGVSTEVINVSDIYNEFNNGYESPLAIKSFLKHAYENWSQTNNLKYVLFIGDAERSYKKGNDLSYIVPTFQYLVSEKVGYISTDTFYGYLYAEKDGLLSLDENPIMDLYIGRIPARSVFEAQSYLNKLTTYKSALPQTKNLILAGDDFENEPKNRDNITGKRVFLDQSSRINEQQVDISNYEILRRASKDDPSSTSTVLKTSQDLQNIFNSGVNHILFMGHGGGALWDDNQILTQEKAELLENDGRYPVISSMTCFIGAFDDPSRQTLGEILVLEANKGAIGLLGASGVSLIYNQYMINYYLNIHREKDLYSYGEVISLAKLDYYRKGKDYIIDNATKETPQFNIYKNYVVLEFNYLGDPSIQIKRPEKVEIDIQETISGNSNVAFTLKNLPQGSYVGEIECFDYLGEEVSKKTLSFNGSGDFSDSVDLNSLTSESNYYFKGYLKSDDNVFNFGKKAYKSGFGSSLNFSIVDAVSLNDISIKTNTTAELLVKLDYTSDFDTIQFDMKMYDINFNEAYNFKLTLIDSLGSYLSTSAFNLPEGVTSIELHNIVGIESGINTPLATKFIFDVGLGHYVVKVVPNSFDVEYGKETKLAVGLNYSHSYKNELDTYVKYYRSYMNEFNQLFVNEISRDTVSFVEKGTTKFSTVSFNEPIIDGHSVKYFVSVETDSLSREAFSRDYLDSVSVETFPNFAFRSELDSVRLIDGLYLHVNNSNDVIADTNRAFFSFENKNLNTIPNNLFHEVLKDGSLKEQFLNVKYFNNEDRLTINDTSIFSFSIRKSFWDGKDPEKITFNYFDKQISSWVQIETSYSISEPDSALVLSVKNGIGRTGVYGISEISVDQKYRVEVSYEVNGQTTNGVHYSASKPEIKIRLFSKDGGYIINPDNVLLTLVGQPDEALPFTYRYSGENNRNLSLTINSDTFDDAISYQVDTKITGYARVSGKNKLSESTASQVIKVSLTDDLIIYGNYPNPFSERTILGYQLNSTDIDEAELTIKIYTISGHLIRTIDPTNAQVLESTNGVDEFRILGHNNLTQIGPNYILWDGKDMNGDSVANGVYFCKFVYKSNGKTKEKIIKLAKVLGVAGGNTVN